MDYVLSFLPALPWYGWAGIAFGAFVVMPRLFGGLLTLSILGGLAFVAVVAVVGLASTAGGMFSDSWARHEAGLARAAGYDDPAYRARIAPSVCPRYHDAGWFMQTVHGETRLLKWCAAYKVDNG